MKTNTFSTWLLWALTMVAGLIAYRFMHPTLAAIWVVAGSAALLFCSFFPLVLYAGRGRLFAPTGSAPETHPSSGFLDALGDLPAPVDPWEIQRSLMRMSDQRLPDQPMVTNEVLMYYALILEESSEAGVTLLDILRSTALSSTQLQDFALMRQTLASTIRSMSLTSKRVRQILQTEAFQTWKGRPLNLREARLLLDDHVDIQVVNSGFGLAAGLPAAAGYVSVGMSNASKADPVSGRILKDPSGKWLKGKNYQAPSLEQVLIDHFPELAPKSTDFAPTQPVSQL